MSNTKVTIQKGCKYSHAWAALAIARISMGFIFLWAFLDKTFGLGYATEFAKAWIEGGSPTAGFLTGASQASGPFADFFGNLAGQAWVDYLFMIGLLGIGVALILGIGLRIAAAVGTVLMVLMWMATMPLVTNPVIDDHIVYAIFLWVMALGRRNLSLADWWLSIPLVRKNTWLW